MKGHKPGNRKLMILVVFWAVFSLFLGVGALLVNAAVKTWTSFDGAGGEPTNVTYDPATVVLENGSLKTKKLSASNQDDTSDKYRTGYDINKYQQAASGQDASLVLTETTPGSGVYNTSGTFTSRVLDGGTGNTWSKIKVKLARKGSIWIKAYGAGTGGSVLDENISDTSKDYKSLINPCVIKDGSVYKMWYTGIDSSDNQHVFYAESTDGKSWTKGGLGASSYSAVLNLGGAGTEDCNTYLDPYVIKDGSIYKMWYASNNSSFWRILYAESTDGKSWTKGGLGASSYSAVLTDGTQQDNIVYNPCVIKDGSIYKMWYTGMDNATNGYRTRIFYAESTDGKSWTKGGLGASSYQRVLIGSLDFFDFDYTGGSGTVYTSYGVGYPQVIKDGEVYRMWYDGYSGKNRIGYAESTDGSIWTKTDPSNEYLSSYVSGLGPGSSEKFDSGNIKMPDLIKDGSAYKMWYAGTLLSDPTKSRIGYAFSAYGVQVRSGNSLPLSGDFVGPDGTSTTYYYDIGGKGEDLKIVGNFNAGHRYVQYQITLNGSTTETPYIDSVVFDGNNKDVFDETKGDFDSGAYTSNTVSLLEDDRQFVGLSAMKNGGYNSTGTYTSQVFDSGSSTTTWDSLSWTSCDTEKIAGESGLVGFWHMNEGGQYVVNSALGTLNTYKGTLGPNENVGKNDPEWTTVSKSGAGALSFDGNDDYVLIRSLTWDKLGSSYTLEAWVKLDSIDGSFRGIISDGYINNLANTNDGQQCLGFNNLTGFGIISYYGSSSPLGANGVSAGLSNISTGSWYHVVGVRDAVNNKVEVYVNGESRGSAGLSMGNGPYCYNGQSNNAIVIGRRGMGGYAVDGLIDEVAVYNRVLSVEEIKAHYEQAKFQVRAGNSVSLTGDFVGADGSTASFITTSGTGLTSVFGRYFQYRATLKTSGFKTVTITKSGGNVIDTITDTRAEFDAGVYDDVDSDGLPETKYYADEVKLADFSGTNYPVTGTNTFISQVFDAGQAVKWASLSWEEDVNGYGEPLAVDTVNGMLGLWHFDSIATGQSADSSGNSKNASISGGVTATNTGSGGRFGESLNFDGVNGYAAVPAISGVKSVEFWINNANAADEVLELNGSASISIAANKIAATGWVSPVVYINGSSLSSAVLSTTGWNYVVVTTATAVDAAGLNFGKVGSGYMAGKLDEIAVWNRALSAKEVIDHYKRGVCNIKMQVATSADNSAWSAWKGVDGTDGNWITSSPQTLSNINSRYLKYKATLSTSNAYYSPILQIKPRKS